MNLKGLSPWLADELRKLEKLVNEEMDLDIVEWHFFRHSYMRILANRLRLAERDRGVRFDDVGIFESETHLYVNREWITHIVDWFRADIAAGAPWIGNLDEKDRPRKLMKCSTIGDLLLEADKAMDRRRSQMAKALGPDDEEHVADLGGGYSLVRLLTPAALDFESGRMRHCIGDGAYDGRLAAGWGRYLSVRDRKGSPVATVELKQEPNACWSIRQIAGKANKRPAKEVMDALRAHVRRQGWWNAEWFWPVARTPEGVEYDLDAIPEGTTIESLEIVDLDLEMYPGLTLPPGLTVQGDLRLPREVRISENLTVLRVLEFEVGFSHSPLVVLPESLDADEIRIGSPDHLAKPVPVHLLHRIKCRVRKLTGHSFISMHWDKSDVGLENEFCSSWRPCSP